LLVDEKIDMLLIYGAYDENATRTKIIHAEKNILNKIISRDVS